MGNPVTRDPLNGLQHFLEMPACKRSLSLTERERNPPTFPWSVGGVTEETTESRGSRKKQQPPPKQRGTKGEVCGPVHPQGVSSR